MASIKVTDNAAGKGKMLKGCSSSNDKTCRTRFKAVSCRAIPSLLAESIPKLNDAQSEAVQAIGLGALLSLGVKEIPQKLAYYVLTNFNECSSELIIDEGNRRLHIDEEDVYLTLGLPRGGTDFVVEHYCSNQPLLAEWRNMSSPSNPKRVSAFQVQEAMLAETDGGEWFKRQFLILTIACLVENTSTGYINQKLFGNFVDVSKVADLNWCKYTMKSLIEHKANWRAKPSKAFLGPILFLVDFYVDRIEFGLRNVPRNFPTICGWDQHLLRSRQKAEMEYGCFGTGYPSARISLPNPTATALQEPSPQPAAQHMDVIFVSDRGMSATECSKNQAATVIESAKQMHESIAAFCNHLREGTHELLEDSNFRKILEKTQSLLGATVAAKVQPSTIMLHPNPQSSQSINGNAWSAECEAALLDIEASLCKQRVIDNYDSEKPSFSLGLTQMEINEGTKNYSAGSTEFGTTPTKYTTDPLPAGGEEQPIVSAGTPTEAPICYAKIATFVADHPMKSPTHKKLKKGQGTSICDEEGPACGLGSPSPYPNAKGKGLLVFEKSSRVRKQSAANRSPFVVRIAHPAEILTREEKEIYCWLFHNDNDSRFARVFDCGRLIGVRNDFLTLAPKNAICNNVVNVWSRVLNNEEEFRAPSSPLRFFASTDTCLFSIVNAISAKDVSRNETTFITHLTNDLSENGYTDVSNVQLFFFPIRVQNLFYLICVNFLKETIDIIDNSDAIDDHLPIRDIYGRVPHMLRDFIAQFLLNHGMRKKGLIVSKFELRALQMSWRDHSNSIDSGVYLMRHMESYMGDGQDRWQCGLRRGWKKPLSLLRAKYARRMLLSNINALGSNIKSAASAHYLLINLHGAFDVDRAMFNSDYAF